MTDHGCWVKPSCRTTAFPPRALRERLHDLLNARGVATDTSVDVAVEETGRLENASA
jgi:hypothetical protein